MRSARSSSIGADGDAGAPVKSLGEIDVFPREVVEVRGVVVQDLRRDEAGVGVEIKRQDGEF